MIDRHKTHKALVLTSSHTNLVTNLFNRSICENRHAKFVTGDNHLVTCKACQRLLNEQRSKAA
jgi:uncharacterized protein YejL (UPF0352 family)